MALTFGSYTFHAIRDGSISLDGGAMFGVVPRVLWERALPADERHRVTLALRCLLIVKGDRRILVDDGAGTRWDGKHKDMYGIDHRDSELLRSLAAAGFSADDITDVVLTHLHFDHAGGTTRLEGTEPQLTFPNATWHLQRRHWKWAHHPTDKDRGSFRPQDFAALERSGRLHLLEGGTELIDGVHLFISEGHTVGLQLVRVETEAGTVVFCGDLIPTTAHLRAAWVAAYDLYPLTVIEEKKQLLAQAIEEGWTLFLEHDPVVAACTVKDDGGGNAVVDQVVAI